MPKKIQIAEKLELILRKRAKEKGMNVTDYVSFLVVLARKGDG